MIANFLNPINWFTKGVEAVGDTVVKVKGAFSGNVQERDQQAHTKFVSGLEAYAAEFAPRTNRTWWDSLWDGINRMPRPVIVVSIFGYFILAYVNPKEFQVLNVALDTVPDQMWWVMSAVVGFYFVSREFQKNRERTLALSDKEFTQVQKRIASIREEPAQAAMPSSGSMAEAVVRRQQFPAPGHVNASVEAWKSRQAQLQNGKAVE